MIQITHKHICNGKAHSCSACPASLAIREYLGEVCAGAFVYQSVVIVQVHNDDDPLGYCSTDFPTPSAVQDFIRLFDNCPAMALPLEFEIPGLDEWVEKHAAVIAD